MNINKLLNVSLLEKKKNTNILQIFLDTLRQFCKLRSLLSLERPSDEFRLSAIASLIQMWHVITNDNIQTTSSKETFGWSPGYSF